MQQEQRVKARKSEVFAGLTILAAAFTFMIALLIDFRFVSPYGTPGEDLSYLFEHVPNQLASSIAWLATALTTLLAMPFYVYAFHRRTRVLSTLNALLVFGASAGFVMMGISGLQLHHALLESLAGESSSTVDEQTRIAILGLFHDQQQYRHIGSSLLGAFAFGLGLTRFRLKRFPTLSSLLLIFSGPALIYFNWYDPDHVIRTAAIAGMLVGILIFSSRLINRGM